MNIDELGIWTLLIGAGLRVESFTSKKLIGVMASFAGVILTSTVDITGENDSNRGSFPHKSSRQFIIGDALALLSAMLYGRWPFPLPFHPIRCGRFWCGVSCLLAFQQDQACSLIHFPLGIYTTVMKKKIGDEARVHMPLFFGFVGLFNIVFLLPGFPILHATGVERFVLPPTRRIWSIVLVGTTLKTCALEAYVTA